MKRVRTKSSAMFFLSKENVRNLNPMKRKMPLEALRWVASTNHTQEMELNHNRKMIWEFQSLYLMFLKVLKGSRVSGHAFWKTTTLKYMFKTQILLDHNKSLFATTVIKASTKFAGYTTIFVSTFKTCLISVKLAAKHSSKKAIWNVMLKQMLVKRRKSQKIWDVTKTNAIEI